MSEKDGGPAFPTEHRETARDHAWTEAGMTLRDYFAGQAMAALIQKKSASHCEACQKNSTCPHVAMICVGAYDYADAMIAERKK